MTTPKRVRCILCGRRMAQVAPRNRDPYGGGSAHRECLGNACGSMRKHYMQAWEEWKIQHGVPEYYGNQEDAIWGAS